MFLDPIRIPFRIGLRPQFLHRILEDPTPHILPVEREPAVPGEMIQSQRIKPCPCGIDLCTGQLFQPCDDIHPGGDRHIAYADPLPVRQHVRQRLRDKPGGIGEIRQHRLGRGTAHLGRDGAHDRDRPQGLGHPADAGRFLTDQAVSLPEILIFAAGGHLPDPQLSHHIGCPCNSLLVIIRQFDGKRIARRGDHAPDEPADDLQAFWIDIHQPQLAYGKDFRAFEQAVNKFGRIRGTAADNCDFHIAPPKAVCREGLTQKRRVGYQRTLL